MFKIFPGNMDNTIKAAKDLMKDTTFLLDFQKLEEIIIWYDQVFFEVPYLQIYFCNSLNIHQICICK